MTDSDIRDELITNLLAGLETTATALAGALYALGRHPHVFNTVREDSYPPTPGRYIDNVNP